MVGRDDIGKWPGGIIIGIGYGCIWIAGNIAGCWRSRHWWWLAEALEDFDLDERYFRQKFNIMRTRRIKTIAPIPTPAVGM
jgi:hypothetical protein